MVAAELIAKAAEKGVLRVIVALRVPLTPEDGRPPAIEATRNVLLREVSHTPHRVLRTYDTVPLIALDVSPAALRALGSSGHVVAVHEDTLAAPHPSPASPGGPGK